LSRREGREGFEPGQVRRRRGFPGVNSMVLEVRPKEWAWALRKETAE